MNKATEDAINKLRTSDNEHTHAPYWIIIDPRQNMGLSVDVAATQIYGIFFSREDAENYLKAKGHHFSKRAKVYCNSGYCSKDWQNLFK